MRRVKDSVPMPEAKRRALEYLQGRRLVKASEVASAIWPGVEFKSQGAGAAASRILKALEKDGAVRWSSASDRSDWGWERIAEKVRANAE